jgi:hypothetical protein
VRLRKEPEKLDGRQGEDVVLLVDRQVEVASLDGRPLDLP